MKAKTLLILIVVSVVIPYLIVAFVLFDLNPENWTTTARYIQVAITTLLLIPLLGFYCASKLNSK
jgi:hypothetical protein